MGRRKILMKKIEDQMARQVCFSKRKENLFKKASELSTLCGAQVAIILFSPGGHLFVYAQPSLHAVAKTCFSSLRPTITTTTTTSNNNNNPKQGTQDLLKEHTEILPLLAAARARVRELKSAVAAETAAANPLAAFWERPIEDLCLSELETLRTCAELAKERIATEKNIQAIQAEMAVAAAAPPMGDDLDYRLHYFDGGVEW